MTIQDAIKSGKPFRRKGWGHNSYLTATRERMSAIKEPDKYLIEWEDEADYLPVTSDIIATDWEIKP